MYLKTVAKENLEILIPTPTQLCQLCNHRFLVQTHKKTILVKLLAEKKRNSIVELTIDTDLFQLHLYFEQTFCMVHVRHYVQRNIMQKT